MQGPEKNSYKEFGNEKKFLQVENSPPHFINTDQTTENPKGASLKTLEGFRGGNHSNLLGK